jgi:hypothetical protein
MHHKNRSNPEVVAYSSPKEGQVALNKVEGYVKAKIHLGGARAPLWSFYISPPGGRNRK